MLRLCIFFLYTAEAVSIENKCTIVRLISILKDMRGLKIRKIDRSRSSGSNSQRFIDIQPYIANQQVSLPADGAHTEMCINHMKKITNNNSHAFDDIADTCSDAVRIALIDKALYGCNYRNNPNDPKQTTAKLAAQKIKRLSRLKQLAHTKRI